MQRFCHLTRQYHVGKTIDYECILVAYNGRARIFTHSTNKGIMILLKQLGICVAVALLAACSGGDLGVMAANSDVTISGTPAANAEPLGKPNEADAIKESREAKEPKEVKAGQVYTVASNTAIEIECKAPCTFTATAVNASFGTPVVTSKKWTATLVGTKLAGTVTVVIKTPNKPTVTAVINVKPALSVEVTGAGTAAADGSYKIVSNSPVTVTCNMPCTFAAVAINSSYTTPVITPTTWTATVKLGTAKMKTAGSVQNFATAPLSSLTVTGSAGNQIVAQALFNIAAVPFLTDITTVDLVKSANAANNMLNNIFFMTRMSGTVAFGGDAAVPDALTLTGSQTYSCPQGGESVYSFSVANLTQRSVGDTSTIAHNQCNDGNNDIKDGIFSIRLTQFTDVDHYKTESVFTNYTSRNFAGVTGGGQINTSIVNINGTFVYSVYTTNAIIPNIEQTMTGNASLSLTNTTDATLPIGTTQYSVTNVVRTLAQPIYQPIYIDFMPNTLSFDANDGIYAYAVSSVAAKYIADQNVSVLGTKGPTTITYGAAVVNVSNDYVTADVSGTNTDGTAITPVSLPGWYFGLGMFSERGTPR
jgi:hypothetical protein